jgi:hypothetical protein
MNPSSPRGAPILWLKRHRLMGQRRWPLAAALCVPLLWGAAAARANDFPTLERVVYVQECMRAHPGPSFEMTSKCACALDALARDLSYEDYVTLNTISKATTMAGERGSAIRDAPELALQLKRYRVLQQQAEKGCFIATNAR